MDTSKWLQALTYIFAVIGFLAWVGDRKCEDTNRSRANKRFLRIIRMLWLVFLLALGIVNYRILSQRQKAPSLWIYLNGFRLTNNVCLTIPTTNNSVSLEYAVSNMGDTEAENVTLSTYFPQMLTIHPSGQWIRGGVMDYRKADELKFLNDTLFFIKADVTPVLPIRQSAIFVPLTLQCTNFRNSVSDLLLVANAKNNTYSLIRYRLHVTNGVGEPYIGF